MFRSRVLPAVVASTITALTIGGITWATQSPVSNGVVNACFNTHSGAIHLNVQGSCGRSTPVALSEGGQAQGPSYLAYAPGTSFSSDPNFGTPTATYTQVASVSVPAGSYDVSAEVGLGGRSGDFVSCIIQGDSTTGHLFTVQPEFNIVMPIGAEIQMTSAGSISVNCDGSQPWATEDAQITALGVSSIN